MVTDRIKKGAVWQTVGYLISGLVIAVLPSGLTFPDEGHPHKQEKASIEKHEHQAPHGGKMLTVGSHHVEVVVEADAVIKVFLYDSENRPVPIKGINGQIHLTHPDNHRETLELAPSADQTYFEARMKDQGHANFKAVLSLVINGQRQNMRVNL